jgi:hypothetical protein
VERGRFKGKDHGKNAPDLVCLLPTFLVKLQYFQLATRITAINTKWPYLVQ